MSAAIDAFFTPEPTAESTASLPAPETDAEESSFPEYLDQELDDETMAAQVASSAAGDPRWFEEGAVAKRAPLDIASVLRDPSTLPTATRAPDRGAAPTAPSTLGNAAEAATMPLDARSREGASQVTSPAANLGRPVGEARPGGPGPIAPLPQDPEGRATQSVRSAHANGVEGEAAAGATDVNSVAGGATRAGSTPGAAMTATAATAGVRPMTQRAEADEDADATPPRMTPLRSIRSESSVPVAGPAETTDAPRPAQTAALAPETSRERGRPAAPTHSVQTAASDFAPSLDTSLPEVSRATNAPSATPIGTPSATPAGAAAPPPVAAPEVATASLEARMPTAPVEEMPARIEWLAQRGGGAARVELDPPHLGRIEMVVRMRGADVEVVIAASEPVAQAAVQAQRAQLVENLAARDLRLSQFDVTQSGGDANHRDSARDGRPADAGRDDGGRHSADRGMDATPVDRPGRTEPGSTGSTTDSRIDLHA